MIGLFFAGQYRHKRNKPPIGKQSKTVLESLDENNPVIVMFKEFATELDDKHDRYERIVKLSRDITIESKRIIFLLHNINADMQVVLSTTLRNEIHFPFNL